MRISVAEQLPLLPQVSGHEHMAELAEMSCIIDAHPKAAELVLADLLVSVTNPHRGSRGLSGDQVLRAAIIKQANGYSYEQLAFHLADSLSYRRFCRLGFSDNPASSTLQGNIKKIRAETMESINSMLAHYGTKIGAEDGQKIRTDCTVVDSNIHEPTDSLLLFDCVRVLARCLRKVQAFVSLPYVNHTRRAKRRSIGIMNAKNKEERVERYGDLIFVAEETQKYAQHAVEALGDEYWPDELQALPGDLHAKLQRYLELTDKVVSQSRRRVLNGESVPATEKVVSIFECHTDIIIKSRREILYGHKICLTTGASGLVLDCVIESGNPADSNLAIRSVERQLSLYGRPPKQACFDGGFSSKDNLAAISKLGVEEVVFSKAPGIGILEMAKSRWAFRKLKHFRAGIESNISFLKRSFGLTRCTWRSLASFKVYTLTSVVAANLLILARHTLR